MKDVLIDFDEKTAYVTVEPGLDPQNLVNALKQTGRYNAFVIE